MTDEEREICAELAGRGNAGTSDSREAKAGRSGIAACCPCCGCWHEVDERGVRKHLLRKRLRQLDEKAQRVARRWLEENWELRMAPPGRRPNLLTRSLGRIYQTGMSKGMRTVFLQSQNANRPSHAMIAWNYADSFGENYLCIPIGQFFEVITRLCNDAPEFNRSLQSAINCSLKGKGPDFEPVFDERNSFRV